MKENIVFGINAVSEALGDPSSVSRVYFAKGSRGDRARDLLERAKNFRIRVDYVPRAKLNVITGTQEHQGIAAAVAPVAFESLDVVTEHEGPAIVLVADRIQHARNLGMLVRTALGAGAVAVVLPARESAAPDDTVMRASAGALLRIPVVRVNNIPQALRKMKDADYWIFGLDTAQNATNLFAMDWPLRVAIVAGNESTGLRPAVKKNCDGLVQIPLENDLDSLNVAVATGLALFEAREASIRKRTS